MTIRHATTEDIPRIIEMGLAFLRSSPYAVFMRENPQRIQELATELIASPDGAVLLLARDDGSVCGMLALVAFNHFLSSDRFAGEVVYWVDPDARGAGVRLLRKAEAWARERGAGALQMISPNPRVDALYDRLGYVPTERSFYRRLKEPA